MTHDARVHREAATLARSGLEPVVVGVVSTQVTERRGTAGGAPLLRLAPRSPLGRIRDRVRPRRAEVARRRARQPPVAAPSGLAAWRRAGLRRPPRPHRRRLLPPGHRRGPRAAARARCTATTGTRCGSASRPSSAGGTHVVYDSHELWADRNGRPELRPWLLAAEALFVRVADEVVTTSPGYADELARRYRIPPPDARPQPPRGRRRRRRARPSARRRSSTSAACCAAAASSRRSRRSRSCPSCTSR